MQLGTRWNLGDEPPARLAENVVAAIREVETEVGEREGWRWTLTWLEDRPVVELDDGTTIRMGYDGTVSVEQDD
ncbi:hypothetical protein GCM10007382_22180 [Salinibacterium xinjiangense]|uniref:Uncharacterized protein n=1 Tax=Salinibacterium xinjiangense TaxID=386302 RepID=A0A2C8ZWH4_9MICO|nr:hypothetical protein [Salinibacterium xinjiangense]GGL01856.1 hypothetical protein GCM10007382_22180 [Salinibacterium xinjiangense]SOE70363.1 hypothetical protein SAMN06296378_2208 [Salinibacterium xinjiangense]